MDNLWPVCKDTLFHRDGYYVIHVDTEERSGDAYDICVGFSYFPETGPMISIPLDEMHEEMQEFVKNHKLVVLHGYAIPGIIEDEYIRCTLPLVLPGKKVADIISDSSRLIFAPSVQEEIVAAKSGEITCVELLDLPEFCKPGKPNYVDPTGLVFYDSNDNDSGYESDASFDPEDYQDLSEEVCKLIMA
jgi:hypothetical protein